MRRACFALAVVFGALGAVPAQAAGFLQDLFSQSERTAPVIYRYAPAQPQMRFIYDEGLRVSRRPQAESKAAMRARQIAMQRRIAKRKVAALRLKQKIAGRQFAFAVAGLPASKAGASKTPIAYGTAAKALVSVKSAASLQPALCCRNGEDPSKLIHNDTTLRVGDAYMTTQGLRIYRGRAAGGAQKSAFVDYRKAEIAKEMKSRLAAFDDTRHRGAMPTAVGAPAKAPDAASAKSVANQLVTPVHLASPTSRPAATVASVPTMTPKVRTALDPAGRVIRVVGP